MKHEFIDLRKELEFIQKRYGFFWVALRSIKLGARCSCIDQYEMPLHSCTKCMGTGHLFVDKLVRAQRARSTPGINLNTDTGLVNTETKIWIIHNKSKPKETDWILELDLDESTGIPRQPFSVRRVFKIQNAWAARGKRGRIGFWYCFSEERNFV